MKILQRFGKLGGVAGLLLLAGPHNAAAGTNLLQVRDAFYSTGQTVIVYIDVTNEDAFSGFQCYLTLPPGLTFDGTSYGLTTRKQDHGVACNQVDGVWRFLGYSLTNAAFLGNSGAVLQLTCTATGGIGTYAIAVSNARLSNKSGGLPTTSQGGQIIVFNPANAAKARIVNRLEGWNITGGMNNTLAMDGRLPLTSPYPQAPRTASSMPTNIADWILLELRTSPSGAAVYRQSYLLRTDGALAELDGVTSNLTLGVPTGSYWIVLRHRNHAAVMSAAAQSLVTTVSTFDFGSAASQYYGGGGTLSIGRYVMPAGDIDQDGHITSKDYLLWYKKKLAAPAAGYYLEDLNGDGVVTDADFTLWQTNARAGLDSRVP